MHFRLLIVTLERFDDVPYKRFIDSFFDYRYRGITVDSDPHHRSVVFSADPIPKTTAVFILVQTPKQRIYSEFGDTIVNIVPTQVSNIANL